jgi:hypothetical protein
MPTAIVKRSMVVCSGLCMLTAIRANAQTYWRAATECAGAVLGAGVGLTVAVHQHDLLTGILVSAAGIAAGDVAGSMYGAHADEQLALADDLSPTRRAVLRSSTVICGAALGANFAVANHMDNLRGYRSRLTTGAIAGGAVALLVEQRFFDHALWPRQRRLNIRVVPVRRGLALVIRGK